MTTPLFWKSCEIYIGFYNFTLRHQLYFWLDAEKEKFVTFKTACTNSTAGIYICCVTGMFLFSLDVLYEVSIAKTYTLSIHCVLANSIILLIASLCLLLISVVFPNIKYLMQQYFNTLLQFEKHLLRRSSFNVTKVSIHSLLLNGKYFTEF